MVIAEARVILADNPKAQAALMFDGAVRLADKAERIYQHNDSFARKLRGASGREYLYAFMRHWCAGFLLEEHGIRVPQPWALGAEPEYKLAERSRSTSWQKRGVVFKPGEIVIYLHQINGRSGKEWKREEVEYIAGDDYFATIKTSAGVFCAVTCDQLHKRPE